MKFALQIQLDDCSLLGKEILQFMSDQQISMREMARRSGLTHPGLRSIILKQSNPAESNVYKIAEVMGRDAEEICWLVYQNRVINLYEPDLVDTVWQTFETLSKTATKLEEKIPEPERASAYQRLDKIYRAIKSL